MNLKFFIGLEGVDGVGLSFVYAIDKLSLL